MTTDNTNERENRDGMDSSFNNGTGDGKVRKKRARVGDLKKQSYDISPEDRERNPYRNNSNEGNQDYERPARSSYSDSNNGYGRSDYRQDDRRDSNYSSDSRSRRPQGYDSRNNGGYQGNNNYNNSRSGGGYQGGGNSYNRDSNRGGGGSYGRDNNRGGGGYGGDRDNNRSYSRDNNSRNDGGNYRPRSSSNSYGSRDRNDRNDRNSGGGYSRDNNRGGGGGYSNDRRGDSPKIVKKVIQPVKYKENLDPSTEIRLNKFLANAGVCSRREADAFITEGLVKVNGEVVSELGSKVLVGDMVTFNDRPIRLESKVYVLLNKPKNCVTTSDDPQNRTTVMDLVKGACQERIYPVGRLDRNTTGVLLLTNDGDLASKLMHPKYAKKKIYQVTLDRNVAIEDMQSIADGIELDDGEIHADSIAYESEDEMNVVGIEIHSGRNRIVRRIFEKLNYQVIKLDRVYFAGLTKKNVRRGKWRYLSEKEVNMLRMGAFE